MRRRPRHGPRARLLLTLAALGALIIGYYLGQSWQRRPLDALSAIVYADGQPVSIPDGLRLDADGGGRPWRLFVAADTTAPACRAALPRFGLMMNRLAAWPKVQDRVRLTVLAYDAPSDPDALAFRRGATWIDVVSADTSLLEDLGADLGILPEHTAWCTPTQLNGILVDPGQRRWALIPFEDPQTMAQNIQAVIQFVD